MIHRINVVFELCVNLSVSLNSHKTIYLILSFCKFTFFFTGLSKFDVILNKVISRLHFSTKGVESNAVQTKVCIKPYAITGSRVVLNLIDKVVLSV